MEPTASLLTIHLLGRFNVAWCAQPVVGLDATKTQELFSYLLVHRGRAHARSVLASVLWADYPQAQAQKYLRQSLWQLQTALSRTNDDPTSPLLLIEPDWIRVNAAAALSLDVAVLENTFQAAQGVPGEALPRATAVQLQQAVTVYGGDLLEGWHQDWCLCDRERIQSMYLAMLTKLMAYCEAHQQFEDGVHYGETVLGYDRAHERTHQRLMRLHYLSGDRTAALRQFQQCAAALHEELGVRPSKHTLRLHDQIRCDEFGCTDLPERASPSLVSDLIDRLHVMRAGLADLEQQLQGVLDR